MHIGNRNVLMGRRFTVGAPAGWTPSKLGASLLAWWDAERPDLITQSAGAVSSWKDIVTGCDMTQATGTAQPIWSATSFGGRPGITFDGVDDTMTATAGVGFLPSGSAASEDWYTYDQTALPADATGREIGAWGSIGSNDSRRITRVVASTVNRARIIIGNGASNLNMTNVQVNLSGRTVVRGIVTPTNAWVEVNGVPDTPFAVVPATVATRIRMAAQAGAAPAGFGQGVWNARLITGPLTAPQATQLLAFLNRRL